MAGAFWALLAGHDDGDGFRVVYSFLRPVGQRRELVVRLPHEQPELPSLAGLSYPAGRFERELRDLFGIEPVGHPMARGLVRHGHWPTNAPDAARRRPDARLRAGRRLLPVCPCPGRRRLRDPRRPIHAGIIEPGHFRFSVVGETILRMKARLWFVHRGMERPFQIIETALGMLEGRWRWSCSSRCWRRQNQFFNLLGYIFVRGYMEPVKVECIPF